MLLQEFVLVEVVGSLFQYFVLNFELSVKNFVFQQDLNWWRRRIREEKKESSRSGQDSHHRIKQGCPGVQQSLLWLWDSSLSKLNNSPVILLKFSLLICCHIPFKYTRQKNRVEGGLQDLEFFFNVTQLQHRTWLMQHSAVLHMNRLEQLRGESQFHGQKMNSLVIFCLK